uniref:Uncharacterized protein n=1 Tax=Quercus lobata TaxID=97700 RepID=A0A7N2M7Z1_QUELO
MVNIFAVYKPLLCWVMKLVGMRPQRVEIEPGTVMNIWVPNETPKKSKNSSSNKAVVFIHGFAADDQSGRLSFKLSVWQRPDLVDSMVLTCSAMALTKSISDAALERIGFKSWSDYLLPDSVQGVKILFDIATFKLPRIPNFIYKHHLEVMFDNRKEREELLEALVIDDNDFTIPSHPQV